MMHALLTLRIEAMQEEDTKRFRDYMAKLGFDKVPVILGGVARHPTAGIVRLGI